MGRSGEGEPRIANRWGSSRLLAFLLLKREGIQPRRDIVYMATADEETGGKWGVGWLFENHPEMMKAEFVINEGGGVGMVWGSGMFIAARPRKRVSAG